jgi:hypothetical protein
MHPLRLAVLLATTALLPACSPFISCSDEFRPGARVTVVDSQGRPQPDARVTYIWADGPELPASCVPGTTGTECREWQAGPDEPGTLVIKATSADGTRKAEKRLSVTGGLCHVDTEQVRLTLPD